MLTDFLRTVAQERQIVGALALERRRRAEIRADSRLVGLLADIARFAPRAPGGAALAYARTGRTVDSDTDPLVRSQRTSGKSDEDRREAAGTAVLREAEERGIAIRGSALPGNDRLGRLLEGENLFGPEVGPSREQRIGGASRLIETVTDPLRSAVSRFDEQQRIAASRTPVAREIQRFGRPAANRVIQTATAAGEDLLGGVDIAATRLAQGMPDVGPQIGFDQTSAPNPRIRLEDLAPLTRESLAGRGGEGFFVAGEGRARAVESQIRTRGAVDGHAGTVGRWTAAQFVDPDETAFDFVSGAIDFYKATAGDPANVILAGVGRAQAARRTFELNEQAAGAYRGLKKLTHGPTVDQWLSSQTGQDLAGFWARETDAYTIWERSGRKFTPEISVRLADTRTPAEAMDVARTVLGISAREVPRLRSSFRQVWEPPRFLRSMPEPQFHWADTDGAVRAVDTFLLNAQVPRAERARMFRKVAEASGNRGLMYQAVYGEDGVLTATFRQLREEYGVPEQVGRALTRAIDQDTQLTGRYYGRLQGNKFDPGGFTVDGEFRPILGPDNEAELLNSMISLPDARAIRRRASVLYRMGGENAAKVVSVGAMVADTFNSIFKPLALVTRLAYPVRLMAELQVRMAADGLDSLAGDPLAAIAWMMGNSKADLARVHAGQVPETWRAAAQARFGRGAFDVSLDQFANSGALDDVWADLTTPIHRAMSSGGQRYFAQEMGGRLLFQERTEIAKLTSPDDFVDAVGHEIAKLHNSMTYRETARALSRGDDLDDVIESFLNGPLQVERRRLMQASDELARLDDPANAASFIRERVVDRIKYMTGNDPALIDALGTGRFNGRALYSKGRGVNAKLDREFRQYLDGWRDSDLAPDLIVGNRQRLARFREGEVQQLQGWRRDVTRKLFDLLSSRPENYLARNTTFRQYYTQRILELAPYADPDEAARWVSFAQQNNMPGGYIGQLRARIGTNSRRVSIEALNQEAKWWALRKTDDLLWAKAQRMQIFDTARFLFPFGDAWAEVIKSWVKLSARNPRVLRRAQQVIQGARGNGFFYTSPETGEEVFAMPGSAWLNERVAGIPIPFEASVQAINPGLSPTPGVGVALQSTVDRIIPNKPQWDTFREMFLPYGTRPINSWLDFFLPSFAQKLRAAGALPFWKPTPEELDQRKQNIDYAATYLLSTGAYDQSSEASMRQLMDDAADAADRLMIVRGVVQNVAPAPPQFRWKVRLTDKQMIIDDDGKTVRVDRKTGQRLADLRIVGDYFRQLQEAHDYDHTAVTEFLDTFGPDLAFVMQPTTRTSVYTLPSTDDAYNWLRDNPDLPSKYPTIYGLFAPDSGEFDMRAYRFTERRGEREEITGDEFWRRSNNRIADAIYGRLRDAAGPNPNEQQRQMLAQARDEISEKFPGWRHASLEISKPFLDGDVGGEQLIDEFRAAVEDDRLKDTRVAQAIREYIRLRDIVRDSYGGNGWSTAKRAARARAVLRDVGAQLVEQVPEFAPAWDQVFSREGLLDDPAELEEVA